MEHNQNKSLQKLQALFCSQIYSKLKEEGDL